MTTWLALDVGDRRIGLAAGSEEAALARPLGILERRGKRVDFAAIALQAEQIGAERMLVGLPFNMDGSEGPQARRVRHFVHRLGQHLDLPITMWDERLTSFEADLIMAETGQAGRGVHNDAIAAAVLLQSFFDHATDTREPRPGRSRDLSGS